MGTVVTDLEAQGLLPQLKGPQSFLCAVVADPETGDDVIHTNLVDYEAALNSHDRLVFHNGIGYDHPALAIMGVNLEKSKIVDTLVMSRLAFTRLAERDAAMRARSGGSYPLPPYLTGSHSLKAWGYRLNMHKGEFKPDDWETAVLSDDMIEYCHQDGVVTTGLLKLLRRHNMSPESLRLEHDIAWLMQKQESNGFKFDEKAAGALYADLAGRRLKLERELVEVFGCWYAANGVSTPKQSRNYKELTRGSTTKGASYTKVKVVTFNPNSRQHIALCLQRRYGWKPTAYTPGGEPSIDEDVLSAMDYPEAALLSELLSITKTIGLIGEGKNAWLKCVTKEGFIHGSVNPNGAGTGRASHSRPNIGQVPKGVKGSIGHSCRTLFGAPTGWSLLGTDASGLELRALANRLAKYDGGEYVKFVTEGDVHWVNACALGLATGERDKSNPAHEAARDLAKTWIYAFLYGAGNELLGETVGFTEEERALWSGTPDAKKVIAYLKRRGEEVTVKRVGNALKGKYLRESFISAVPAIDSLQSACKKMHKEEGHIVGLDGRKVETLSGHSATNYQLQCDGAVICKKWGVLLEKKLIEKGLKHGWDGDFAFCAWVHDEYQIACKTEAVEAIVGKCAIEAIKEVGSLYNLACPLDADFSVGKSWADTH